MDSDLPDFLPENCVEYILLVAETDLQLNNLKAVSPGLEAVRKAALRLSDHLTKDYIWQRDGFNLDTTAENGLVCLRGVTDYGDSVEDEWLIVYILRELTKQFPTLWARVSDSDGEFLLVEAANVLPGWLNPENDHNRVWIHGGQLKIIPIRTQTLAHSGTPTLLEAASVIRSAGNALVHSPLVEAEAFYRLEKYPDQIQNCIHHAIAAIPRRLAYVLHETPKTIAPAVEAFYLRDPAAMKPLMTVSTEHSIFPPIDLVNISIKFTKTLYAQLKSQPFSPPPAWRALLESSRKQSFQNTSDLATRSMLELGTKVTCAFEMLAVGTNKSTSSISKEFALLLDHLIKGKDSRLPSDTDIASWEDSTRDDDESWMNIDIGDFQQELRCKTGASNGAPSVGRVNAQADLRRVVARFQAFLNDEKAGLDGAEYDQMNEEDDEAEDELSESGSDDGHVSFDEGEFARIICETMDLPTNTNRAKLGHEESPEHGKSKFAEDSDSEEIRKLSEQMEAELGGCGALKWGSRPKKPDDLKGKDNKTEGAFFSAETGSDRAQDEDGGEELDIDYNLASNLLESFRGQTGVIGPVGMILADMGIWLPRDEDGEDECA